MQSLRFAAATAALTIVCTSAAITSITLSVNSSTSSTALGSSILLRYTYVSDDALNATRARLRPYIATSAAAPFAQWGSSYGPLRALSATTAAGEGWLALPAVWDAGSLSIVLAAHALIPGFSVGRPLPADAVVSNAVTIDVSPNAPSASRVGRPTRQANDSIVGIDIETWFTPLNFNYGGDGVGTAESISIFGRYDSFNVDVMLLQGWWLAALGVDSAVVDWTNNVWDTPSWDARHPNVLELTNASALLAGVWAAQSKTAGWAGLPSLLPLLGLDNGPITPMPTLMEELAYSQSAYANNVTAGGAARLTSLPCREGWPASDCSSPLVAIFDGTGANHSGFAVPPGTVIRWMSTQNQNTRFNRAGYWSWMDGAVSPPLTIASNGRAEAGTATPAFFADNGWLAPAAVGRQGGLTLVRTVAAIFREAIAANGPSSALPLHFLSVCQLNEYAGQTNGGGYGPNNSTYVDSYSPDLSNDLEPTSPFECGYRRPGGACGGWGFTPLNMLGMLIDGVRSAPALDSSLLLAITAPVVGTVTNYSTSARDCVLVSWESWRFSSASLLSGGEWLLREPHDVAVTVDGVHVMNVTSRSTSLLLNVSALALDAAFPHVIAVSAIPSGTAPLSVDEKHGGTAAASHTTRYPLSFDFFDADAPLAAGKEVPATATAWLWLPESVA